MKHLLLFLFNLISINLFAQNAFYTGISPKIDLNTKYKKWKFHLVYEDENIFLKKVEDKGNNVKYIHNKSAFMVVITHKVGVFSALGGGYYHDFVSHKQITMQQFLYTKKGNIITHSHRFRIDEQFHKKTLKNIAFRYRLSLLKPLNGYSLEPREFYFKSTFEQLLFLKKLDFDSREGIYFGYYFSNKDKIEIGAILKSEHLIAKFHTYKLWGNINWYLSF